MQGPRVRHRGPQGGGGEEGQARQGRFDAHACMRVCTISALSCRHGHQTVQGRSGGAGPHSTSHEAWPMRGAQHAPVDARISQAMALKIAVDKPCWCVALLDSRQRMPACACPHLDLRVRAVLGLVRGLQLLLQLLHVLRGARRLVVGRRLARQRRLELRGGGCLRRLRGCTPYIPARTHAHTRSGLEGVLQPMR